MELSKRLYTVASAVTPGNRVADVGTDHGYIPIYLVKQQYAPSAFALDVNKGPLERAKEHIQEEGLEEMIQTRLGNGLEKLSADEVDSVVVAGMGGDLICRILKAAPEFFSSGKEFILQPQSEWFKVRRLLHQNGYGIVKEWFLEEEGKYYVVIKALPLPKGEKEEYSDEFEYAYGRYLLEERHPVLLDYMRKECRKKTKILLHMEAQEKQNEKQENTGRQQKQDKTAEQLEKEQEQKEKRQAKRQALEKEIEKLKEAAGD